MPLESFAVMRKPAAPAEIRFSMACTCDSLSPSCLPAKVCSCTPWVAAAACAPSFIFTKNGLVSVLVIRPTTGWLPPPAAPPSPPPHAASASAAAIPVARKVALPPPVHAWLICCAPSSSLTSGCIRRQRCRALWSVHSPFTRAGECPPITNEQRHGVLDNVDLSVEHPSQT